MGVQVCTQTTTTEEPGGESAQTTMMEEPGGESVQTMMMEEPGGEKLLQEELVGEN